MSRPIRFSYEFIAAIILLISASSPIISHPEIELIRDSADGFDPSRIAQISWRPRAFLFNGFLSHEECDHLIELAKGNLTKSKVVDSESGKGISSDVRTSSGMFLEKKQDEIVARIERRIALWTFLPEENGESIHVLRYQLGQKYEPHFDYFVDKVNLQFGGNRYATVLMYLSDVQMGGETVFPNAEGKNLQKKDDSFSDCAKNGYAVKPKKGDALLFFSMNHDGTTDAASLHGSCAVIQGEKWSATKWIHVGSFESTALTGDCVDRDVSCTAWAAAGECAKNPRYMVGSPGSLGFCRKSCNVCSS